METVATRNVDASSGRTIATERGTAEASQKSTVKNFAIGLFGEPGRMTLWITCLAILVASAGVSWWAALGLTAVGAAIRFIGILSLPTSPLNSLSVRRDSRQIIRNELLFSVVLISIIYLADLPIGRSALGIFIAVNLVAQLLLLGVARVSLRIMRTQYQENTDQTQQVLIVGTGKRARDMADHILDHPELRTSILGFLDLHRTNLWRYRDVPLLGNPDQLRDIISANHVDMVLMAVGPEDISELRPLIATAEKMGVAVGFLPDMFRFGNIAPRMEMIGGQATILYDRAPKNRFGLFGKWVVDKIGAIVGLLLCAPLTLAVAIAIKCDSRGPVLFRQKRTGRNGKTFDLYKFRTMCCDAEEMKRALARLNEMSGPVFKITDDPRVTRIGKILRKYSIDEVPQFLNVLKGDMSLVGPRPPLPSEVLQYKSWQHRRLSVKPGITCSWQVSGRNGIDFEDWMRLDLDYIDNWSLRNDASLLVRTIPAVLKCDGAS